MESFQYTNPRPGDQLFVDAPDRDNEFLVSVAEFQEGSRSVYLTMDGARQLRDYLNTYLKD